MGQETALLQSTLDSILQRLLCLESSLGIQTSSIPSGGSTSLPSATPAPSSCRPNQDDDNDTPASLIAFDKHTSKALTPLLQACQALPGLSPIASHLNTIWNSMRDIILLASQCRKPSPASALQESLAPHLAPIQSAMGEIRHAKLDRCYDWHVKSLMEMLACVSWVVMSPPPAPSSFVKDTLGATEFWTNKIRKEYKGKQQEQIDFCDALKGLILDLSSYVKEYHLSGLLWNPKGVDVSEHMAVEKNSGNKKVEAACDKVVEMQVEEQEQEQEKRKEKVHDASTRSPDFMKELASKRTSDGNSAATGLRKVSREQQTWRKEYKAADAAGSGMGAVTSVKPSAIKAAQRVDRKKGGSPSCQFQAVGNKWVVEYQTKESNPNGVCTIDIQNPKEQVYM